MNRFHLSHRQGVLRLVTFLGLLVFGPSFATAQDQPTRVPLLLEGTAASVPGSVLVSGQNFTPGGVVYVALYDTWGKQLHETRWAVASQTVFGTNGSGDPASGFDGGGTINELFAATGTVYGLDGSQDPANGYVKGTEAESLCGASVMARAYDAETEAWSNLIDIGSGCASDSSGDVPPVPVRLGGPY